MSDAPHLIDGSRRSIDRWLAALLSLVLAVATNTVLGAEHGEKLLRLAIANSLCQVMERISVQFTETSGIVVDSVCKSSGRLAKGIVGGTLETDFFISANRRWMDYVVKAGLVAEDQVKSPLGNSLIVAVIASDPLVLDSLDDLASDQVTRIIIGDPGTAPFGRYAKQALIQARLWRLVRPKIQTTRHISLAAKLLSAGKPGTVAILYRTNLGDGQRTVFSVPEQRHETIRYYTAPLRTSSYLGGATNAFDAFLNGEAAQALFRDAGFKVSE